LQSINVSAETVFNPNGTGVEVWQKLQESGELSLEPEVHRPRNLTFVAIFKLDRPHLK